MFITYFRSCLIVIRFRCFLLDQTFYYVRFWMQYFYTLLPPLLRWRFEILPPPILIQHFQEPSPLLVTFSSPLPLLCYTSSVFISLSFILYSFIVPLSHSIFAHLLYLPRFNFVPIHLDLSARLLHKQHCCSLRIHNRKKTEGKRAWNVYLCACICVWQHLHNEGSESMHIHLFLSFSSHSVLLHLIPPSVPPIFPINKPPQSLPAEDE